MRQPTAQQSEGQSSERAACAPQNISLSGQQRTQLRWLTDLAREELGCELQRALTRLRRLPRRSRLFRRDAAGGVRQGSDTSASRANSASGAALLGAGGTDPLTNDASGGPAVTWRRCDNRDTTGLLRAEGSAP